MNTYWFKECDPQQDGRAVTDLLFSVKDELRLPDRTAADRITTLCFENGGVIGAYAAQELVGICGYFYGDPARDFENKEIAFLYVGAIVDAHRRTGIFARGLLFGLKVMAGDGAQAIRLQAEAGNPVTNRLYARFAERLGEGRSLRGLPVITYGSAIDSAIAYLERGQRPTPHAVATACPAP